MADDSATPAAVEPTPQSEPLTLASLPPEARVAAFQAELHALCAKYRIAVVTEAHIAIYPVE